MSKTYYPIFADLHGRSCLVVGGGAIAQRKVAALLACGASITIVSPMVTRTLAAYAAQGRIRHRARRFAPSDLKGAWLACAATDDQRINERVCAAASARRIFVNVVDQPPLCSFIAPAIVRRGPLTIAISTGGASPSLAKQLRRELRAAVGPEYGTMARLLGTLRVAAKRRLPRYHDRKRYFGALVTGRAFRLVRAGQPAAARREALAQLAHESNRPRR